MKVITVEGYGDFDMPYTDSVWVNESLGKKDKVELGDFSNDREPDNLIKALKQQGFRPIKPQSITFGGNY